jgi:hypothetical protein
MKQKILTQRRLSRGLYHNIVTNEEELNNGHMGKRPVACFRPYTSVSKRPIRIRPLILKQRLREP